MHREYNLTPSYCTCPVCNGKKCDFCNNSGEVYWVYKSGYYQMMSKAYAVMEEKQRNKEIENESKYIYCTYSKD